MEINYPLPPKDALHYQQSLKVYRDLNGVITTAFDEGRQEERLEIGAKLKQRGFSNQEIVDITGLSEDEIAQL